MLPMKKELLVALRDIKQVVIECKNCHSQLRVSLDAVIQPRHDYTPLGICPICLMDFDSTLPGSIEKLRTACNALSSACQIWADQKLMKIGPGSGATD